MMPAAKHYDPILGVDIHIIQPPGPVPPVPIPHPFVGFLIDPFDYVPILGATVMINGIPRAIAGTAGKCVPPHIPIGGTFVKPPGNECEMFMGSSTVTVDGDAMSYTALPALSCQCVGMPPPPRVKKKSKTKSLVLPTSVVLPIPAGPPVLIGGPPTISMMAIGMKLGLAGLAKGLRRLAKSGLARRAGAALRRLRQRLFRNMRPGFFKCRILRAEPVDIITGEVIVDQQDFSIPGRIPIEWNRHYGSHSDRPGVCGHGWETPADARLELEEDGSVTFYDGTPGATLFPSLPDEGPVRELVDGAVLDQTGDSLTVRTKAGRIYCFPTPETGVTEILVDRVKDLCGNYLQFIRDENGLKAIQESAGRRIEVVSENGLIRQMQLHHPDYPEPHPLVRYEYSERGDLVTVYDALDAPYRFRYDDHRLAQHTDRNGLSFYYEYDTSAPEWRCVHSWGDGGLYNYRFEFDDLLSETRITDSLGHLWTVRFDERQLPVQESDPLGGVTQFEYDEVGRTTAVTDPSGNRTEYERDDRGNLIRQTAPDSGTALAEYNSDNLPIKLTDPNGNSWQVVWNAHGRMEQRISPRGATWSYSYDANGSLVKAVNPRGAVTRYEKNPYGVNVLVLDALNRSRSFKVDAFGRVLSARDPAGRETSYQYDRRGNVIRVTTSSGATRHYTYDNEGNTASIRDALGNLTRFRYAGLGEVAERVNPDGTRVCYERDTEERLIALTNERGERFRWHRDPLGRVARRLDYWGGETVYRYDAAGNLAEQVDPLGRVTRFEYDPVGRLIAKDCDDAGRDEFRYDPCGNRIGFNNDWTSVEHKFDEEHHLIEEQQGNVKIEYEFDLNGNRVARRSSHGNTITYQYDVIDCVTDIHANGKRLCHVDHDVGGDVIREELAEDLVRRFAYDEDRELIHQELRAYSRPILDCRYRYDEVGNLVEREDSNKGAVSFAYDPRRRIRQFTHSSRRTSRFAYDSAGDLLRTVQAGNGLSALRTAEYDGTTFRFDAAGNLVERDDRRGRLCLTWDGNNRLVATDRGEGNQTSMGYDPVGRRLFKKTDDRKTTFCWDGDAILSETNHEHGTREYVFYPGSFIPLAFLDQSGQAFFFQNDNIGLPHEVFSATGETVWSAMYGPFGEVESLEVEKVTNPLRFPGQYFDEETELSYTRNRYYDPRIGSFASLDPLGLVAGENLYRYAPNPWRWWDPFGLTCRSPTITAADITGKTRQEIRDLADDLGLVPKGQPDSDGFVRRWHDPETGNQRLRLDRGHVDPDTGLPYDNPNAAVDHVHAYEPDGQTKIRDPDTNDPHFPTVEDPGGSGGGG